MSPRVIHIPLSIGDRKAQAKARREARGIAGSFFRKSQAARAIGEAKLREADQFLCDAWTSVCFGESRNSPTIAQAINGGRPLLWAKCHRCDHENLVDLRMLRRRLDTLVHLLAAALFCEHCSQGRKFRQRAAILGWRSDDPSPAPPKEPLDD